MSAPRSVVIAVLVVALVVPVGAVPLGAGTPDPAPQAGTEGPAPAAADDDAARPAATATETPGDDSATNDSSANDSAVNVTVGQQLSTVIATTESDVGTEVEGTAFEIDLEGADSERAAAIADRAEELRERAVGIAEEYREATRAYERGDIGRSEYARRIAVLNARARNLLASYERLRERADDVSGFELAAAGLNRTALRETIDDVENVTGAGPSALLERFTGQRRGEVELERADGLSIEVESEDGERSREIERERDDDETIAVNQTAALATARGALSAGNGSWVLEEASVHPESGYYKFEFRLRSDGSTGEAEVRVDGSTGEVFRLEEEIEPVEEGEDDEREAESDEGDDESGEIDELALVVAEGTPAPNATLTVRALADGEPAPGATVLVDDEVVGETDANGTATVTLSGGSTTVVVRTGGEDAELEFEFEREDDERERAAVVRAVDVDATLDGDTVTLTVAYNGTPISGVTVHANDRRVGTTGDDGTVAFATNATEELELELVKGELEVELAYRVRDGSLVLEERSREGDGDEVQDEIENLTLSVVAGEPAPGATVTVRVLADGEPAADATVVVDDEVVGRTDADGELAVTFPDADEVEVTATAGGEDAELEFEFDEETEGGETEDEETPTEDVDELSLSVLAGDPSPGATITVEVTANGGPVEGATVSVEGEVVGETGADGTISVTLPAEEDDVRVRAEYGDADGRIEFDFEED